MSARVLQKDSQSSSKFHTVVYSKKLNLQVKKMTFIFKYFFKLGEDSVGVIFYQRHFMEN
jgi:hypothetical protein